MTTMYTPPSLPIAGSPSEVLSWSNAVIVTCCRQCGGCPSLENGAHSQDGSDAGGPQGRLHPSKLRINPSTTQTFRLSVDVQQDVTTEVAIPVALDEGVLKQVAFGPCLNACGWRPGLGASQSAADQFASKVSHSHPICRALRRCRTAFSSHNRADSSSSSSMAM